MKIKTQAEWQEMINLLAPDEATRQLMMAALPETLETRNKPKSTAGLTKCLQKQTETIQSAKVIEFPKPRPEPTIQQQIARELELCRNCNGVECTKRDDRYRQPEIEINAQGEQELVWYVCPVKKQRRLNSTFRCAQIPPRYVGKTFDDYKADSGNAAAVKFAKNFSRFKCGAYFFGECGTGKTFLASLIAQDFLREYKSVLFIKVPSLLEEIRSTFDGKRSSDELFERIETVDLLVLDDFGMEKPTQWSGSTMCRILDMRYDASARTIITSNLSLEKLEERLNHSTDGESLNGSRIADRCREICKPILLAGRSRRK